MNVVTTFFERIIGSVVFQVGHLDRSQFVEDYSGLYVAINPEIKNRIHEVAIGVARLLMQNRLGTFVISFDTISFCMKFRGDQPLKAVNTRIISTIIPEIPESLGGVSFLVGIKDESFRMEWIEIEGIDSQVQWEIFPLIDFENICIYYAKRRPEESGQSSGAKPGSSDNSQHSMPLSQIRMPFGISSSDGSLQHNSDDDMF